MSTIHAEASRIIGAAPEVVYDVIADYHKGHWDILPKRYFKAMTVEEGGHGAGTVVKVEMNVMGVEQVLRLEVSEPEPGRVLVEQDKAGGTITTFRVEPLGGGGRSRLTIATDAQAAPGIRGWLEKIVNPMIMRRIFNEELALLAAYVEVD